MEDLVYLWDIELFSGEKWKGEKELFIHKLL